MKKIFTFFYTLIIVLIFCTSSLAQKYIVVGWNETGMHEFKKDFQNFAMHPPHNVLRAQVMRLGNQIDLPEVVTSGIRVTYEIPGNTYSVGKTNFWEYEDKLYGKDLADNTGLTGLGLSGDMVPEGNYFIADGIPATPYTDNDLQNPDPYQLALIKVYDQSGNLLAQSQPVLPVSNEIGCVKSGCHSSEQHILDKHEDEEGFDPNNKPILCVSCHASNLAGTTGTPGLESFSEVIHDKHVGKANNCYNCHSGPETQFYRGAMTSSNSDCKACHGTLRQLANSLSDGREPWLEEPGCAEAGCHSPEYAPEPGKLFKDSQGHAGVACSFCHGSPHAINPSSHARDNVQMIALQGESGTLSDCQVCHGERLAPGPGPHGILPELDEFKTSLHATRSGKAYWYSEENGGFESITGIPIDSLGCQTCHGQAKADGSPIDAVNYQPDCYDCHDINQWTPVAQGTCLGCHSRQKAEIDLAANPESADHFSDVHRDAGMVCTDCHTKNEIHGDGQIYNSMLEPGAIKTDCSNENCHPASGLSKNYSHDTHAQTLDCASCHVQSVVSCYSCHFETEVVQDKKRFYGPPAVQNFVMLVNSEKSGKVTTATYQSLTYQDSTFYAVAPYLSHTIQRTGRDCIDCHQNEHVKSYFNDNQITVTKWDAATGRLNSSTGVIPVPPDWSTALQMDFVTYSGMPEDPVDQPFDPDKWTYLKTGANRTQMLFASPLSTTQMNLLDYRFTSGLQTFETIPGTYSLGQNYPNPFNPVTHIEFQIPESEFVSIKIFNLIGKEVATLVSEEMNPGNYRYRFDGKALASGVYYYQLVAGEFREVKKMILLR
jgi:hypothetical protein